MTDQTRTPRRTDDKITPMATLLRAWAHNESKRGPFPPQCVGPNKYLVDLLLDAADLINIALSSEKATRDKIIEECARELDRKVRHINENAASLRKFPGEDQEARARELGAMYVEEGAATLRSMKSDSPLMKLMEKL